MPTPAFIENLVRSAVYKKFMKFLVLIALVVSVVGLVMLLIVKHSNPFLICGFGLLAVWCFFRCYDLPVYANEQPQVSNLFNSNGFTNFAQKMFWWSSAVLVIGFLFFLCHFPGWNTMIVLSAICFPLGLVLKLLNRNAFKG